MSITTTVLSRDIPGRVGLRQGTTINNAIIEDGVLLPDITYTISIPLTYTGSNPRTYVATLGGRSPINPVFGNPGYWQKQQDGTYQLTVVASMVASSGSLNITFKDIDGSILLDKFQVIPGHLDTNYCANGDYSDSSIKIIFTKLSEFLYNETIFDSIRNTLAEFFANTAFEQGIIEIINLLNGEFISGQITLQQFQELSKKSIEDLAGQYGKNYEINFIKLVYAINKYKYLVPRFS